jgi:uncharacterized membrane protein YhaH (DUF805 family)
MSKPVFEDLFSFTGRRNRQSYILLLLAQLGALIGLTIVTGIGVAAMTSLAPLGWLILLAVIAGFITVALSSWAAGSQRIRDFNQSGVWILLTLIPYVGFVVCLAIIFIPSTEGENKYGPSCI